MDRGIITVSAMRSARKIRDSGIADAGMANKPRKPEYSIVSTGFGMSKRERNKADKLQRIKDAALAMFLTKGFDEATTRDIARIAGVALGTLFVYAENKRDLLFLIYNDELAAAIDEANALIGPNLSMLDNILSIARVHFAKFVQRPELARAVLREMYFYMSGKQAEMYSQNRENLVAMFHRVVDTALKEGAITSGENADVLASIVFTLYQGEARRLLMADRPDLDGAVDIFARKVIILMRGLSATEDALTLDKTRWRASNTLAD